MICTVPAMFPHYRTAPSLGLVFSCPAIRPCKRQQQHRTTFLEALCPFHTQTLPRTLRRAALRGLRRVCRAAAGAAAAGLPNGDGYVQGEAPVPLNTSDSSDANVVAATNGVHHTVQPGAQQTAAAAATLTSQGSSTGDPLPQVPWGFDTIVQVMLLWLVGYFTLGQVAIPLVLSVLGLDRVELSVRGHALLHLCLDLSQLAMALTILSRCLARFKPLAAGFFPLHWRGRWPLMVLAGWPIFPLVDWVAQQSVSCLPTDSDMWASQLEMSLGAGDWITNISYFAVVSVCAPLWEEIIFRGFLLTSLTRYLPRWGAVLASALFFALCHFRVQTFLPLVMLGVLFAAVTLLSRNLAPSIVLHSCWNVYVLVGLLLRPHFS